MAPPQPPKQTQFGMELEFLAHHLPPLAPPATVRGDQGAEDVRNVQQDNCRLDVARALTRQGLRTGYETVQVNSGSDSPSARHAYHFLDTGRVRNNPPGIETITRWLVKEEGGLDDDDWDPPYNIANWVPVEVNTPILPQQEFEQGIPNIGKALTAIMRERPQRIHINSQCGLHVHVSNPREDITLRQMKRMVTLCWLLDEKLFLKMVANHRPSVASTVASCLGTVARETLWAAPGSTQWLSAFPETLADLPAVLINTSNIHPDIVRIWAQPDIESMRMFTGGVAFSPSSRHGGLAISSHPHPDPGNNAYRAGHTFEFRHAQSSFCRPFVHHWIGFVLTLFKLTEIGAPQFQQLLFELCQVIQINRLRPIYWEPLLQVVKTHSDLVLRDWEYSIPIEYWRSRVQSYAAGTRKLTLESGKEVEVYPDIFENGLARPEPQ